MLNLEPLLSLEDAYICRSAQKPLSSTNVAGLIWLGRTLSLVQVFGAAIILGSVCAGQRANRPQSPRIISPAPLRGSGATR
nr:hypothetical protein [Amylibacter sp.]